MSDRLDDVAGPDGERASVALVMFAGPDALDAYAARRHLSFPILVDPDRSVYRAYGLGRGSLRDVWGWATLRRYGQILGPSGPGRLGDLLGLARRSPGHESNEVESGDDTRQLGGDFVIAPDGRLAWGHWSTGPADRPDVDDIVAAVETARAHRRRGAETSPETG